MPRYTVSGLPPEAANGKTAFVPHFNRLAASGALHYKTLWGGPAQRQYVGRTTDNGPDAGSHGLDPTAISFMGTGRSNNAMDFLYQNQYVATNAPATVNGGITDQPGAGMPIQVYSPTRPQDTTMIPVPAVSLRALYQARAANLARGVAPGGQRQVQWPGRQAWARWKNRSSFTPANY